MLIVSLLTIITLYANFVNRENKNLNSFEFRFFMNYEICFCNVSYKLVVYIPAPPPLE